MIRPQRITTADIYHELRFVTSRSSGPGGQNVNKVNSRVTLRWDVAHSSILTDEQRQLILQKLTRYISRDGELILHAAENRSQLQNKETVVKKLNALLQKAFTVVKKRTATRPTAASKIKRLESKKRKSEKKQWRRDVF
jgi:ribosome-associated protein